jgi:hypothetical protein
MAVGHKVGAHGVEFLFGSNPGVKHRVWSSWSWDLLCQHGVAQQLLDCPPGLLVLALIAQNGLLCLLESSSSFLYRFSLAAKTVPQWGPKASGSPPKLVWQTP